MRMTIDAGALRDALGQSFTGKHLEILEHALFEVDNDRVRITTQDLSKQSVLSLPVTAAEKGAATAKPADLRAVLGTLSGEVTLAAEGKEATEHKSFVLQQANGRGKREYDFLSLAAEDFPDYQAGKRDEWKMDGAALRQAIATVEYAAAKKDSRAYLNGVFIGRSSVLASSGHRLAYAPFPQAGKLEMIIPTENIKALLAFLRTDDEISAWVYASGEGKGRVAHLGFAAGGREITLKCIAGQFPDISKFLRDDSEARAILALDRQATIDLCQRMIVIGTRKASAGATHIDHRYCAGIALSKSDEQVLVEAGERAGTDFLPITEPPDDFEPIGLDAYYLRDALQVMEAETCNLHLLGPEDPVWLSSADTDDVHVIMPMRI